MKSKLLKKIYSFCAFPVSLPLGVFQPDHELAVTIASASARGGIPLRPQRHPAEHQTRRQHAFSPAGLQSDGPWWWQGPRAGTGDREEGLPVGEESVGRVGTETHPGKRRKEASRRGRKEHRQQEQRHGGVPGPQRPSADARPWQLRRQLLARLWGIPRVRPGLGAKRRHGEPLRYSTPDQTSLRRIPVKPPRHQPASSSAPAPPQGVGLTDRGVEGVAGGSRRGARLQRSGRFRGRARETTELGVAPSQESHANKQSLDQIWTHGLGWI